jgi:hypothetical protein
VQENHNADSVVLIDPRQPLPASYVDVFLIIMDLRADLCIFAAHDSGGNICIDHAMNQLDNRSFAAAVDPE